MADLILKHWDKFGIRIRDDRYVSLTDMADATGKKVAGWLRTKSAQTYLSALSGSVQICTDQLIETNESTGVNILRGTWGHPKVAIRFAQWCNEAFAVQVDIWIDELLTNGSVSLQSQKAPAKILNPQYLPGRKKALDKLKEHGAKGWVYGAVESYNNALVGIENGTRHQVDELQAYKLMANYYAMGDELDDRIIGFAKHQNHLKNTCTRAMRHGVYALAGVDAVPESLKPIKERKVLASAKV